MSEMVEAVLLAKSAKNGGSCVGGVLCSDKSYIRFVSADEESHGALKDENMACADGYVCQPLDLVRVPVERPDPIKHQPENWLIDPSKHWECVRTLKQSEALDMCADKIRRFGKVFNTKSSSVSEDFLPDNPERSLELVRVTDLTIQKEQEHKPKVRFLFDGLEYQYMSLTDRDYYGDNVKDGDVIGDAVLLISLPDVDYKGNYYKFVAKVFPLDADT